MALTRADIRRNVAQQTGDLRLLKATGLGSLSTFTDENRLTEEDNSYAGCDIVFTSNPETILGEVRYVTSSDFASNTLTFQPPLLEEPPVGTLAELYNYRQMGCTVDEYNGFINAAIIYAQEEAEVRVEGSIGSFAQSDYWSWTDTPYIQSLTIPAQFKKVSSIYYRKDGLLFYPERGHPAKHEGYWIDAASRRVVIEGDLPGEMDGGLVYVIGYGPPEQLNTDADSTSINGDWLFAKVKALTYQRRLAKGLADARPDVALWEGLADRAARQLRPTHYPPNTVALLV